VSHHASQPDAPNDAEPVEFVSRRNCSIGPAALALVFGSMLALAFGFGIAFAFHGPWMILPFAGLELAAVAAAFVYCARHAGDFERITVSAERVVIETGFGSRRRTQSFQTPWARLAVEKKGPWSLQLFLVQSGRSVEVGRHLGIGRRMAFATSLEAALRRAAAG
jgi:uncharacterized membrane protein